MKSPKFSRYVLDFPESRCQLAHEFHKIFKNVFKNLDLDLDLAACRSLYSVGCWLLVVRCVYLVSPPESSVKIKSRGVPLRAGERNGSRMSATERGCSLSEREVKIERQRGRDREFVSDAGNTNWLRQQPTGLIINGIIESSIQRQVCKFLPVIFYIFTKFYKYYQFSGAKRN